MAQTSLEWLNVYPEGMEKAVNYIRDRYNNTPMFITENGMICKLRRIIYKIFLLITGIRATGYGYSEGSNCRNKESLQDLERVNYMDGYLNSLLSAVR